MTAAERSRLDSLDATQERLLDLLERQGERLDAMARLVATALGVGVDTKGQPERATAHRHLVPRSPGGRARPGGGAR